MSNTELRRRPVDGIGTNEFEPEWGKTDAYLLRLTYNDLGENGEMSGQDRPGARQISNAIAQQPTDTENAAGASDFLWIWGQFLDHDLSLTEAGHTTSANISVPAGDPFFDPFATGQQEIGFNRVNSEAGEYKNEITAYIDASMIYGSDIDTVDKMRIDGGKLLMTEDAQLELEGANLVTGDVRAAENIALSSMHTIFTREHNRLVDELSASDPTLSDDQLFEEARARVEALVQAVTYNEFLPILVGKDAIEAYSGYDSSVNVGISVEFSTAVFRFGHTLLSPNLQLTDETGWQNSELALRDAFFRPTLLTEPDMIENVMRGAATQTAQALDTMVVEDVRSFLFGPPGAGGFDLAALNIQRGRDLGVPSYNDLRETLGLERAESFDDITSDATAAARLQTAYGSVDLVDAWVGGLAEDALDGGLLGETFSLIMVDQFTRLRDGDPFWSEGREGLNESERDALWETRLSDIIARNTDIEDIQTNVFLAMDRITGSESLDVLCGGLKSDFILGYGGNDWLYGRAGDDELRGGEGNDHLKGQKGDDTLMGGDGNDRMVGGAGDDEYTGGLGADVFVFNARQRGDDTIHDFTLGEDRLHIQRLYVVDEVFVEQHGDDIKLSFDDTWTLTLKDFDQLSLQQFDLGQLMAPYMRWFLPKVTIIDPVDDSDPNQPEPEFVFGTSRNDYFDAGDVDRIIDGGIGWDTVTFAGKASEASSEVVNGNLVVTAGDGSRTTLIDVENMYFEDPDVYVMPWVAMYELGFFSL